MLIISSTVSIPDEEIELSAIRSQGAGGQNVNKVSTAIHLRFNIGSSSLNGPLKTRLTQLKDSRITRDGVIIIKAQTFRTQEKNRQDALDRLKSIVQAANFVPKVRRATRPTKASKTRRLDGKNRRGKTKALRGRVGSD